ncbi:hypothetical protein J6590_027847 [Homalodisca vitripennis]|nr:hypothetical protein J6590_027847 [Homalodisca vitripennis]
MKVGSIDGRKDTEFSSLTVTQQKRTWIAKYEQSEVTDEETVNMPNRKREKDIVLEESAQKVSHSKGHKALKMALKYGLEETLSTEVLLPRRLRDLATSK